MENIEGKLKTLEELPLKWLQSGLLFKDMKLVGCYFSFPVHTMYKQKEPGRRLQLEKWYDD